jgi:GNAT superfamily N-acetyltransferase
MNFDKPSTIIAREQYKNIQIKNILDFDINTIIDNIVACENETWIAEWRASKDAFLKRVELFPEGFNVLFNSENNEVAGFSTGMLINYDSEKMKDWYDITGNGTLDTHESEAPYFYVVSMAVSPKYAGKGYGSRLIKHQVDLGKKLGKKVIIGSRVPSYHNNPDLTPEQAVEQDWEVRFYNKHGGFEIKKIIANFGDDPESLNYGVFMEVNR